MDDDTGRRLGALEAVVAEIRVQVSAIAATIIHLATKAEVAALRAELKTDCVALKADIAELRAEVKTDIGALRTDLAEMETKIIKWIIATVLAATTLAFSIAKFVH